MNKTAMITGASRGIGAGIATAFASAGYDLVLTCHKSEALLTSLKYKLEAQYSIICNTFVGDISEPSLVKNIFTSLSELDVLVNNAGISYFGLLSDMELADWDRVMNTNLTAAFLCSKYAIPFMLHNKSGKIINISSVWGTVGASMEVAYSASKSGLNGFTKALAKELAPSNIQVNAIACGVINTDMNKCLTDDEMSSLIEEIPADRLGTPNEVGSLVLQLANASSYLTGQVIAFDGGWI